MRDQPYESLETRGVMETCVYMCVSQCVPGPNREQTLSLLKTHLRLLEEKALVRVDPTGEQTARHLHHTVPEDDKSKRPAFTTGDVLFLPIPVDSWVGREDTGCPHLNLDRTTFITEQNWPRYGNFWEN